MPVRPYSIINSLITRLIRLSLRNRFGSAGKEKNLATGFYFHSTLDLKGTILGRYVRLDNGPASIAGNRRPDDRRRPNANRPIRCLHVRRV
uniref:Ribosomal protein L2 n=1 Tax=Romanomermis culicivorax TaxID=13658 RepID=A0A915JEB1_ROMCU